MPIVINEIEINVEVSSGNHSPGSSSAVADEAASREAIIKECVEKVMEIINQKYER